MSNSESGIFDSALFYKAKKTNVVMNESSTVCLLISRAPHQLEHHFHIFYDGVVTLQNITEIRYFCDYQCSIFDTFYFNYQFLEFRNKFICYFMIKFNIL